MIKSREVHTNLKLNKTPAQAFTPPAEKKIQCRHKVKVGIYVQLLDQAGKTKSGYLRIFNVLTRVITRDLTTEFFLK